MSIILNGKDTSEKIKLSLKQKCVNLFNLKNLRPTLAIVIVGDDPASQIYVASKERACEQVGIISRTIRLNASATQEEVEEFMKTQKRHTEVNIRAAIIGQEREDKFDLMAFKLKEGNLYELAQMLYSSKYQDGFTRHFDKILSDRIQQMKANDFILPQTSIETYLAHAKQKTVARESASYNVQVVESKDIKDFYAIIHTPEAGYATGGSRGANFANFDSFAVLNDDKVMLMIIEEFEKNFSAP